MSASVRAVARDFEAAFDRHPTLVARAPGRINLIGDHTDYQEGFVLPAAIDRQIVVAAAPRRDRQLQVVTASYEDHHTIDLEGLAPTGQTRWHDFVAGTAWAFMDSGHRLIGADLAIRTDLPIGAGLSSSAALEVAVARALCGLNDIPWAPVPMAQLARRAENAFVGVGCGIMDQLAAAAGVERHALLLDCRSLDITPVAVPAEATLVVIDTGVRRGLGSTEYDKRRQTCDAVVKQIQRAYPDVETLRDVDTAMLHDLRAALDPTSARRAAHVVAESARPARLATALEHRRLGEAGALLDASHASLRDLYEVSCPELDLVTDLAHDTPGCHGARMTGAGFGGSAVALVDTPRASAFVASMTEACAARPSLSGQTFACHPAGGASLVTDGWRGV